MTWIFGYAIAVLALSHLWLQGFNRHYILIDDGPMKKPLNHGWFAASVFLPAMLLLALRDAPEVRQALEARPESPGAWVVFTGIATLVVFMMWRFGLWLTDRSGLRHSQHLRAEEVVLPRLESQSRRLPIIGDWDTTTALEIVRRDIEVPCLPAEFDGLTIAQVSDIHYDPRQGLNAYLEEVREQVNALWPDFVIFTGDFVNVGRHIPASLRYHARFRARLGVFAVMGNHDYWTRPDRIREGLAKTPVIHLDGQRRVFTRGGRRLIIAGSDWPWSRHQPDWRSLLRRGSADACILVTHMPDNGPIAARHGANLVLAGHNHGGQVCLPRIGPIIVPSRRGHAFVAGVYDVGEECVMNVSRGVGASTFGMRILCPPEVTLIRLRTPAIECTVGAAEPAIARLVPIDTPSAIPASRSAAL